MRLSTLIVFFVAVLWGSNVWYTHLSGVCTLLVTYTVGTIDSRFNISKDEVVRSMKRAEDIWEKRLGKDMFTYADNRGIPVNFVFDERQKNANAEAELREDLIAKEGMSEHVAAQYDKLIAQFRELKDAYETRVKTYTEALDKYNATVQSWNDKGGAPENEVTRLETEKERLRTEYESIQKESASLNAVVAELNRIGARGNYLIQDYNDTVQTYNTTFGDEHEFTQGEYMGDRINVYQFNSEDERVLVLAHEFGHALGIEHVENEHSIMYKRMGKQTVEDGLTDEDIAVFKKQCEEKASLWGYVYSYLTSKLLSFKG